MLPTDVEARPATAALPRGGVAGGPAPLHLALVALAAALAYSNSFGVPFHYDDGKSIVGNPAVRDLASYFATPGIPTRAVGYFTFALNGAIHGQAVAGYHALNLAIHVATAFVVYLLVAFACRRAEPADPALRKGAAVAGLAAALLFALHPIQTQAVTYIVQRLASLVTLLYLGSILAYCAAAVGDRGGRRIALYVTSLALALLAHFTKENALTLPFALVAVELTLLTGTLRQRAGRLLPFFALTAIVLVTFLRPDRAIAVAAGEFREVAPVAGPASGLPPWASYLASQPRVILAYLRLVAFPAGQSIDHDPPVPPSLLDAGVLVPAAALLLIVGGTCVVAWRARHRAGLARLVLLGIALFLLGLAIESSIVPLADAMVEHRMYLPLAGLCLIAGAWVARLEARTGARTRAMRLAFAVIVVALGAATFARNAVWRDRATLWGDALSKAPSKSRPYVYLAMDRLDRGDPRGAIEILERAATLPAPAPFVFLNLGRAYQAFGDGVKAEGAFRQALARGSGSLPGAHRGLALVLLDMGRIAEACEELAAELKVSPRDRATRDNAASCRYARGDVAGAAEEWTRLAAEDPPDARVLYNLGLARAALGDVSGAREAFRRFLAVAGPELAAQRAEAMRWLGGSGG